MAEIKIAADSGGGSVGLVGPSTTTGNAARQITLPDVANGTLRTTTTSGAILQVLQAVKTDGASYDTTDSFADISGLSIAITPTSASNKILITANMNFSGGDNQNIAWRLMRDSTALYIGDAASARTRCSGCVRVTTNQDAEHQNCISVYLDSPNTTSETTYKVQWAKTYDVTPIYINYSGNDDGDYNDRTRVASSILVQEVAA